MAKVRRLASDDSVQIREDPHGVCHVRAPTDEGLFRGLGYCHGRDRAVQMLLVRLLGRGEATRFLDASDEGLKLDRFFLRQGFGRGAAAEVAKLAPDAAGRLQAYCDGVNEALARRWPWELRALGVRRSPWTPEDTILTGRLISYVGLAQTQGDMERFIVELAREGVSSDLLDALFPGQLEGLDAELLRQVRLWEPMMPAELRRGHLAPLVTGSNNWAVAGSRTASGKAMLASDPHLETDRLPAVWYEVVLERGPADGAVERSCMGASMPGIPGMLVGRTEDLAWGPTYAYLDGIDTWIEEVQGGRYRRDTGPGGAPTWHDFQVRVETADRKKGEPVTMTFYENDHGTLEAPTEGPLEDGFYLCTRWASGDGIGAASTIALMALLDAPDVAAGKQLLGSLETAWNWVLADQQGRIAYQMSGRVPDRPAHATGLAPLPGWDPANDWQGLVHVADLPQEQDPERGFVATANNDLNHLGRARPINLPMGSYRADRIAQVLASRDDWDVDGLRALQMDVYSLQAERFMSVLRPLLPDTPQGRALADWDLGYDLDSLGATQFDAFYDALVAKVFGARLGPNLVRHLQEETGLLAGFYANFDRVLLDPFDPWYEGRDRDDVWRRVAARLDGPLEPWRTRRTSTMKHVLFGDRLPRWLGYDQGPIALAGSRATVHQSQRFRAAGRDSNFGPSYRMVVDFAEDGAHTILAGGPSDRRLGGRYASEVAHWLAGRLKRLRTTDR